jgi:hypothetical protein
MRVDHLLISPSARNHHIEVNGRLAATLHSMTTLCVMLRESNLATTYISHGMLNGVATVYNLNR